MGAQLRVTVWQHASDRDPAVNRAALATLELPPGTDLLVAPEAFARDFGEPGSPLAPYAEPLDGPFVGALRSFTERTGAAVVATTDGRVLAAAGHLPDVEDVTTLDCFDRSGRLLVESEPVGLREEVGPADARRAFVRVVAGSSELGILGAFSPGPALGATDVHLLERAYQGDLMEAVKAIYPLLEGHFAFVVIHRDHPDGFILAAVFLN